MGVYLTSPWLRFPRHIHTRVLMRYKHAPLSAHTYMPHPDDFAKTATALSRDKSTRPRAAADRGHGRLPSPGYRAADGQHTTGHGRPDVGSGLAALVRSEAQSDSLSVAVKPLLPPLMPLVGCINEAGRAQAAEKEETVWQHAQPIKSWTNIPQLGGIHRVAAAHSS